MKKTVLTFVAVAFGTCVAFAQTTPETDQQNNTEQSISIDRMSDRPESAEAGRRSLKVEELPAAVQQSLNDGEFQSWTVVSVAELQPDQSRQNMSNTQDDAQAGEQVTAIVYEVELMPASSQDQTSGVTEESLEEGSNVQSGASGANAAVVVVRFDSEGNMISREERSEDAQQGNE